MRLTPIEKTFLWIIKIGLWIIPFLPFYISSSMLFPFITGKNFTFRIIVEILAALWVALAISRPEFRPKPTLLVKVVTVFMTILFFADLLSPNPYRSFFSNYERMEGFMMLFHLYLYFLMLVSVFKTSRDWLMFFHVSVITSIAVSYFALLQRLGYRISLQGGFRVDSTIGNPTYLAAYLLFHIWMLLILIEHAWGWLREQWARWVAFIFYAAILFFELAIIYFTATRGAVLALLGVSLPLLAALVIFWRKVFPPRPIQGSAVSPVNSYRANHMLAIAGKWGKGRLCVGALLGVVVVVPFVFWILRGAPFVQQSQVLHRLTNYSLTKAPLRPAS